jgi:hypothetical protein
MNQLPFNNRLWTIHDDGTAVMRFSPTDPNARHAVVPYCVIRKVTDKKTVWHTARFWCRPTDDPLTQQIWSTYAFENPTEAKRWCEAWNPISPGVSANDTGDSSSRR